MKKKIVIAGYGGMGREVEFLIERINSKYNEWEFLGYIDVIQNDSIIGDDDWILSKKEEIYVAIAVGSPSLRSQLYHKYCVNKCIKFPNLVDISVVYEKDNIAMGIGNIICAGSILTTNIRLGNFNIINIGCTISHDTIIGDYVTISPGCNIAGNVVLNDKAVLGIGTHIIQGKTIGVETIIGAGAVVVGDIGSYVTAVGIPAKIIKERG